MTTLFDPLRFGDIAAVNRIAMAPLTRNRAGPGQVPTALMTTCYAQRASAGLIVSEATQITREGQGYLDTPGIHSAAQVAGWRKITQAVVTAIGGGRTGLRLSPVTPANDAGQDSDAQGLYNHVVEQLAPMQLAYIHVVEGATGGPRDVAPFDFAALRTRFHADRHGGAWIVNNGYTRVMAMTAVESGDADMVAFGRPFVGNPDLVERLRENAPLAALVPETLYGGGAAGYTDYPALERETVAI